MIAPPLTSPTLGRRLAILSGAAAIALLIGWQSSRLSPALVGGLLLAAAYVVVLTLRPWIGASIYLGVMLLVPNYVGVIVEPLGAWTPTRALALLTLATLVATWPRRGLRWNVVDTALVAYWAAITLPLPLKDVSLTATFRDGLFTVLDYGVPYLLVRTLCVDLGSVRRTLAIGVSWFLVLAVFGAAEAFTGDNPFITLQPQLPVAEQWTTLAFRAGSQRIQTSFGHSTSLGMGAAALLPLALQLARSTTGRMRWLAWAGSGALVFLLVAALSRGAWMGAAVALTLPPFIQPLGRRRALVRALVLVVAALAVYASGLTPATALINESFQADSSAYGNVLYRQDLVGMILSAWERNAILGFAYENLPLDVSIDNFFLWTLLTQGVAGLLGFVAIGLATFGRLWLGGQSDSLSKQARLLSATTLATLVGQGIVLGTVAMVGLGPQVFWAVVGLAGGEWVRRRKPGEPGSSLDSPAQASL